MSIPTGRGMYVWRLAQCEGGDLVRIIDRCRRCGISWLAVKAGNAGDEWPQFTSALVAQLHAAGLKVYGWSYDLPEVFRDLKDGHQHLNVARHELQRDVVSEVIAAGADGFITDSEVEWDFAVNPDAQAAEYARYMDLVVPDECGLGDAPWPIIAAHGSFPFTAFGERMQFRCPQVYWTEIGGGVQKVWARFVESWDRYHSQPGHPVRPLLPSGSLYHKRDNKGSVIRACTVTDVAWFEAASKTQGCPGVLHWEWSQVPQAVWDAMESGLIPRW